MCGMFSRGQMYYSREKLQLLTFHYFHFQQDAIVLKYRRSYLYDMPDVGRKNNKKRDSDVTVRSQRCMVIDQPRDREVEVLVEGANVG